MSAGCWTGGPQVCYLYTVMISTTRRYRFWYYFELPTMADGLRTI